MENTNVTEQSTNEIMPMAASGETNFASLPEKATPASGDMFLMEDSEDTKKINYDKLADAILNKLTSKTYSGLETTAKNFVTAINELNSKTTIELIGTIELTEQGSSNKKTLPYTTSHKMLYIEYGMKNATQVYGGSNIYIYVNSSRPCFLPVYANGIFVGILYIYNNTETGEIVAYNQDIEGTVLIKVYAYV